MCSVCTGRGGCTVFFSVEVSWRRSGSLGASDGRRTLVRVGYTGVPVWE